MKKLHWYAQLGVPEYWLVDPEAQTMERLALRDGVYAIVESLGGDELFRPASFEGLEIPLAKLWGAWPTVATAGIGGLGRRVRLSGALRSPVVYDGLPEVSMADSIQSGTKSGPTTIVEEGSVFKGDFTSSCPIIVNGRIKGDVKAPDVTVTNSGTLQGNVEAKTIACRGSVAGILEADTIELSGEIAQNTVIRAQRLRLNIESTSGRIELAFGQAVTIRESKHPTAGG